MLSYHISVIEKIEKGIVEGEGEREENGSMRPIGSIDIGQVGNKTDSGTERIVHICVFNLTYVVCVYIYVCDAVPLSFILFFSFFVVLYLLFERSYSKYKKKR